MARGSLLSGKASMSHLGSASGPWQNDQPDTRRRRPLFRCSHRGTQENDFILGSFAEISLAGFGNTQLDRSQTLLDCADTEVFDWITAS